MKNIPIPISRWLNARVVAHLRLKADTGEVGDRRSLGYSTVEGVDEVRIYSDNGNRFERDGEEDCIVGDSEEERQ
jgi:hypothetical protein